jgi:uncharacterized membrane protein YwaF
MNCKHCRLENNCEGTNYCLVEKAQKELLDILHDWAVMKEREMAQDGSRLQESGIRLQN